MSVAERFEPGAIRDARDRAATAGGTLRAVAFGDRTGLALFLATLAFAGLYWRLGFFINDNYTLANGLVSLADGRLAIAEATYGSLDSPGAVTDGGAVYARNYGQLVLALPVLWALEALALVAEPGVALPALWCLVVLALATQAGAVLDRPALGAVGGSALALGLFAANASVARPVDPELLPVVALQLSTTVAAGFVAVFLYRLLGRIHGRRIGLFAGGLAAFATPSGFWATIPKRHALTTALLLGVCYAFYRSRAPRSTGRLSPTGFRALAYALVGLLAWVHAPEAIVVLVALVAVDVPTAPANDRRTIATVAAVFALSLVPFLVTNALLSGNPIRPPRLLSAYGGGGADGAVSGAGGADADSSSTPSDGGVVPPAVAAVLSELIGTADTFVGLLAAGLDAAVSEPGRLYRTFLRGGYIAGVSDEDAGEAISLTVLESAPVLGGLLAALVPAVGAVRASAGGSIAGLGTRIRRAGRSLARSPARATDAFVLLAAALLVLVYLPRLPLHAQVTVRYLLPVYPLAVYGLLRQPSIRRVVGRRGRLLAWTWAGGVLIGAQVFAAVVVSRSFARGEGVQLHAVVGLLAAGVFAAAALASALDERADRFTAVALGAAAALGTNFLLLSGLVYFQYGQYALPIAEWVATRL